MFVTPAVENCGGKQRSHRSFDVITKVFTSYELYKYKPRLQKVYNILGVCKCLDIHQCMTAHFPYEIIPADLLPVVGKFDKNTRSYHAYGEIGEVSYWYEALNKVIGPLVTPGAISMYVPVSRTAIGKRIKEAKFTVFNFHAEPATKGLFLNKKEKRERPYVYVPVSECKAWRSEIEAKMIRTGEATIEEIDAAEPEWYAGFWDSVAFDDEWALRKMEVDDQAVKHAEAIGRRESHSEVLRRVYKRMQEELINEMAKNEK